MSRKPSTNSFLLSHALSITTAAILTGLLSWTLSNTKIFSDLASIPLANGILKKRWTQNDTAPAVAIPPGDDHRYTTQIFSHDPLILYVHNFLSQGEIEYILKASESHFHPSLVWSTTNEGRVDPSVRISESAYLDPDDPVTIRIRQRAQDFRGLHGTIVDADSRARDSAKPEATGTHIESLKTQRYAVGGYYHLHYDWDPFSTDGNRVASFMIYLTGGGGAAGTVRGGGTHFPLLEPPTDRRWCEVIECDDDEEQSSDLDEGQEADGEGTRPRKKKATSGGVTFKALSGSAVFWENIHPNGSLHMSVEHASLPVTEGVKVGLNIWFYDHDWKRSADEERRLGEMFTAKMEADKLRS